MVLEMSTEEEESMWNCWYSIVQKTRWLIIVEVISWHNRI